VPIIFFAPVSIKWTILLAYFLEAGLRRCQIVAEYGSQRILLNVFRYFLFDLHHDIRSFAYYSGLALRYFACDDGPRYGKAAMNIPFFGR